MDRAVISHTVLDIARRMSPQNAAVTEQSHIDTLGWDSLDTVVFAAELEDAFQVVVNCAHRIAIQTLADAVAIVCSLKGSPTHDKAA